MSEKDANGYVMKIASEAISNIRTIASLSKKLIVLFFVDFYAKFSKYWILGQEKAAIERFISAMDTVQTMARKRVFWRGSLNSTTHVISGAAYGIALCYGGYMVANNEIHYKIVIRWAQCIETLSTRILLGNFFFRVSESLLYGIMTMSQTLAFAPAIATAFIGAHRLFQLIDQTPAIESLNCYTNGSQVANRIKDISFKDIDFRYQTRPNAQILNGFNLQITEKQTVALVGPSGWCSNRVN